MLNIAVNNYGIKVIVGHFSDVLTDTVNETKLQMEWISLKSVLESR